MACPLGGMPHSTRCHTHWEGCLMRLDGMPIREGCLIHFNVVSIRRDDSKPLEGMPHSTRCHAHYEGCLIRLDIMPIRMDALFTSMSCLL
ncbi:hypothetical protein CHS0354_000152, partial [Potamilus streckersoni]